MQRLVFVALVTLLLALSIGMCAFGPSDPRLYGSRIPDEDDRARIQTTCEPILGWLEDRKTETGSYPSALPPDYRATIEDLHPSSHYNIRDHGQRFELSVGEYTKLNQWVYYYSSSKGEWNMDS